MCVGTGLTTSGLLPHFMNRLICGIKIGPPEFRHGVLEVLVVKEKDAVQDSAHVIGGAGRMVEMDFDLELPFHWN